MWAQTWSRRNEPQFRAQLGLLLLFAAALGAFAHIAEDYLTADPLVRWDVHFAAWLHEHSSPALVSGFKLVTLAGNVAVLGALTALVAFLLLRRRAVNEAALLCVTALGIEILNAALKLVFHRPRPALPFVHLDTYSFPSGHAAGSAAIYAALAFLLARGSQWPRRIACIAGYVVVVAVIGFSRLYLEAHYLSDVLVGICLGIAWLSLCLIAYVRYGDRSALGLLPGPVRPWVERIGAPEPRHRA